MLKKNDSKMIKKVDVPVEALQKMKKQGKYVEGSIHIDPVTNGIVFKAFNRKPRKPGRDKLVCFHPSGWMKESENNLKFFASVPKRVGAVCACQRMDDDLQYATSELFTKIEEGKIKSDDLKLY